MGCKSGEAAQIRDPRRTPKPQPSASPRASDSAPGKRFLWSYRRPHSLVIQAGHVRHWGSGSWFPTISARVVRSSSTEHALAARCLHEASSPSRKMLEHKCKWIESAPGGVVLLSAPQAKTRRRHRKELGGRTCAMQDSRRMRQTRSTKNGRIGVARATPRALVDVCVPRLAKLCSNIV